MKRTSSVSNFFTKIPNKTPEKTLKKESLISSIGSSQKLLEKGSLISSQNQSPERKHHDGGGSQDKSAYRVNFSYSNSSVKSNDGQFGNGSSKEIPSEEIQLFHYQLDTPTKSNLFQNEVSPQKVNRSIESPFSKLRGRKHEEYSPQIRKVHREELAYGDTLSAGKIIASEKLNILREHSNNGQNKIQHFQDIIKGFFTDSNNYTDNKIIDLNQSRSMQRLNNVLALVKWIIDVYGTQNTKLGYSADTEKVKYNITIRQDNLGIMLCNNISKNKLLSDDVSKAYLSHLNEYATNVHKNSNVLLDLYSKALKEGLLNYDSRKKYQSVFSTRIKPQHLIEQGSPDFEEYKHKFKTYQENINVSLATILGDSSYRDGDKIIDSPSRNPKKFQYDFKYSSLAKPFYFANSQYSLIIGKIEESLLNFMRSANENEGGMLLIPEYANHPQFILSVLDTILYNAKNSNLQMDMRSEEGHGYSIILTSGKRKLHFYYPLQSITPEYLNNKVAQFKQNFPKKLEIIIDAQSKRLINFADDFNKIDKSHHEANKQAQRLINKFEDEMREIYDKHLFAGAYDQLEV